MPEILVETTRVSEKGQVVIPKPIRDQLGLQQGSRLVVVAMDGAVVLQKLDALTSEQDRWRRLLDRARSWGQRLGFRV